MRNHLSVCGIVAAAGNKLRQSLIHLHGVSHQAVSPLRLGTALFTELWILMPLLVSQIDKGRIHKRSMGRGLIDLASDLYFIVKNSITINN